MKSAAAEPRVILHNGAVFTGRRGDAMPEALAVGGGGILAVGRDGEVLPMAGRRTATIDLAGRLVVPGFIDAHIHLYEWALKRQGLALDRLESLDALVARVKKTAAGRPPGQWLMGQGWNETDWEVPVMPTRECLDRAAPHHPVLLWRCDLHLAAANSRALELAGITAATSDPPEGRIERDARGEPTGILRELAINLVRQAIAPPDTDQATAAIRDAGEALHRRGITGVHDVRLMGDEEGADALRAFQKLDQEGRLALRTWVSLPGHRLGEIVDLGLRSGFGNERLRIGHVKYFADGGMGARTAWMIDSYLDAGRGMPLMDMETLAGGVERADRAGLSVMVHAVGDRANREVIDIFEAVASRRARDGRDAPFLPHRIEHVQMIRPEDAGRLRGLGVALCVTPANLLLDMNLIDRAVGEKGRHTYAFRRLVDTGAPVMFSSDCPVCDPAPLLGIHAAVSRQRADGTPPGGWHPDSRLTVAEALEAYTSIPAAAHGAGDLGRVAVGGRADLAVLSRNVLAVPRAELPGVRVDMTLFDGRVVHRNF